MFRRLVFTALIVMFLDVALLAWVGGSVGVLLTIGLVLLTGVIGANLARHQGLRTLARFQESLAAGRLPHRELVDGILILIAATLLITPGFLTDTIGFLLLVPPVRGIVRGHVARALRKHMVVVGRGHPPGPGAGPWDSDAEVIDAEFEVKSSDTSS